MSIFGQLDAENIPTNPYYVEEGEYSAEVTDARFTEKDGNRQLRIVYTINDENSEFLDKTVTDFLNLPDSSLTQEAFDTLPADDKKKIRGDLVKLKRRLCGDDGNSSRKGLGVPLEDLNKEDWDPSALKGTPVNLAINNYGANKQGTGIRWVNIAE